MHSILKKAYLNGTSFKDCVKELESISGLHKHHLKVVFNQNLRQVYSFARYEKQLISDKPYLRYVAIMDNRIRDSHKAFHGLILPKEHSFWRNNYPPNGWGCRCKTQVLSLDEAKALGYKENAKDPISSLNAAVRGFDNNPIEPNNALFKVLEEKVKSVDETLRKQARRIMNNAFTDYIKRESLYKEIKASYDEFKPKYDAFIKQKLKGLENPTQKQKDDINEAFKKKISLITENLKAKNKREHAFIEVAKLDGSSVFLDKYQIATHLKHTSITAMDYTLIDRIIKEGSIDEKRK
ncbi:phage head morphogenesis protein [Campylobacter sp. RM12647]|uniref:phage head morphogenesis protein n=1 Tax=Campylobacter sp. RM12647 TaxID=2735737 RepID=UPI001D3F8482|nr:minor capsid protein [Campylobacter sp. RM12647]